MILSFHPFFVAEENRLVAGRPPSDEDLDAIRRADAVVLPQGCPEALWRMAAENCDTVFPRYGARFDYPGKTGQARLFDKMKAPCPETLVFGNLDEFERFGGPAACEKALGFPMVFKFDWGGGGETVHRVGAEPDFPALLASARRFERTGHDGFLVQRYVPTGGRSMRVAVVGRTLKAYWRTAPDSGGFMASVSSGGGIDEHTDPHLLAAGTEAVREFCEAARIDLAGIDLLFPVNVPVPAPLFLEINWFFGRRGLGGTDAYLALLMGEVRAWLSRQGFSLKTS